MTRKVGETITAAAIRWKGCVFTAPPPARHHNIFQLIWTSLGDKPGEETEVRFETQGFVTSTGRFVNRRQALRIVKAAGQKQIDHPALNAGGQLFSEDLW